MRIKILTVLAMLCTIKDSTSRKTLHYDPCTLYLTLKGAYSWWLDRYFADNTTLIICSAGYRQYYVGHEVHAPDGTIYYGLFGLKETDRYCAGRYFTNEDLTQDLVCLSMFFANPDNKRMYDRLCAPDLTYSINCEERDGRSVRVATPIYFDLFDETFGDEDEIEKFLFRKKINYYGPTYKRRKPRKTLDGLPKRNVSEVFHQILENFQQKMYTIFNPKTPRELCVKIVQVLWSPLAYKLWKSISKRLASAKRKNVLVNLHLYQRYVELILIFLVVYNSLFL
ncbi:hypothetical protein GE061_019282 [Apolygus lucorum]|uniref:Uncharacterized protein n=1 Tax=Apolygus lucorum TaxID=248454 RepID=A0A6A4JRG1_APOLU|nr:hypothetical protein GE061_019282 [Apolygus lucorum]